MVNETVVFSFEFFYLQQDLITPILSAATIREFHIGVKISWDEIFPETPNVVNNVKVREYDVDLVIGDPGQVGPPESSKS